MSNFKFQCMSLTDKNCQCLSKITVQMDDNGIPIYSSHFCNRHRNKEEIFANDYGRRNFVIEEVNGNKQIKSRCACLVMRNEPVYDPAGIIIGNIIRFRYCEHDAEINNALCSQHIQHQVETRTREQALKLRRKEIKDTTQGFWNRTPRPNIVQVIDELYGQYLIHPTDTLRVKHKEVVWKYADNLGRVDPDYDRAIHLSYFRWSYHLDRIGVNPLTRLPPIRTALARLVNDRENVHTTFVTTQTNENIKRIMDIKTDEYQNTLIRISSNWFRLYPTITFHQFVQVINDVMYWFSKSLCKSENDWLYHRLLTKLVTYISHSQYKDELYKRLYEECTDSIGKCCEGHISRLCNVLAGFDAEIVTQPEISLNELIQMKLGAISQSDITTEQKIEQANTFFNEHNVPQEDRQVWLDAF